ncbi:MAG: dienelactone hydrolase family protein [Candidatus Liptonbacteria bacterium]|nr:dienelactone hydrolase family protein [Candidatus Liptonbacteria bacterium]
MRLIAKTFLVMLMPIALSSCIHYSMGKNYKGPSELPKEIADRYSYVVGFAETDGEILEEKPTYLIKRIELPAYKPSSAETGVSEKQDTIVVDYYEIKGQNKMPVIIVLPVLGGNNGESKLFCAYFAKRGLASLMVHRDQKQKDFASLENLEAAFIDMVIDHRTVIDWIATQKKLDSEKIGVFGASMGGIKAALLMAIDNRISAGVFALAGGDLPYILTHSKEKGIAERVEDAMKERGLSKEELQSLLKARIRTDPALLAEYIDARNVLLISAVFDKIVPRSKQRELGFAIGNPERIDIFSGHYTSLLYIFYVQRASFSFFERKFGSVR